MIEYLVLHVWFITKFGEQFPKIKKNLKHFKTQEKNLKLINGII